MHSFYTFSSLIYYFQEVPLLKTSSILDYGLVGKKKKKPTHYRLDQVLNLISQRNKALLRARQLRLDITVCPIAPSCLGHCARKWSPSTHKALHWVDLCPFILVALTTIWEESVQQSMHFIHRGVFTNSQCSWFLTHQQGLFFTPAHQAESIPRRHCSRFQHP